MPRRCQHWGCRQHVERHSPEFGKRVLNAAVLQFCKVEDHGCRFIRSKHNSGWKDPKWAERTLKPDHVVQGPHRTESGVSVRVEMSQPLRGPLTVKFFPLYLTRISLAAACLCCCVSFTAPLRRVRLCLPCALRGWRWPLKPSSSLSSPCAAFQPYFPLLSRPHCHPLGCSRAPLYWLWTSSIAFVNITK